MAIPDIGISSFSKHLANISAGRWYVKECLRPTSYEREVLVACRDCKESDCIKFGYENSPDAILYHIEYWFKSHKCPWEKKKMDVDMDGFNMGIGGGGGISSSITYKEKAGDPSTELVLAVAKASNFKVDAQGKRSGWNTVYRLFCSECKSEFDLGDRFPTKAEIENPTTGASKFCTEHAHRPTFKAVDADNFRKIREA